MLAKDIFFVKYELWYLDGALLTDSLCKTIFGIVPEDLCPGLFLLQFFALL